MPRVTRAPVHAIASPEVIERGEDYHESGAVLSLVRRDNQLQAEVQGSDCEPYRTTVVLGPCGGVEGYGGTGPYDWGGACKHVVATLLAFQHDPRQVEERPPLPTLLADLDPGQLRQLLLDLAGSLPAATEVIEAELATRGADRRRRSAKTGRNGPHVGAGAGHSVPIRRMYGGRASPPCTRSTACGDPRQTGMCRRSSPDCGWWPSRRASS